MTVRFNGWALASMLVASLALAGCETSGPRYGTTYSSSGYGYNGGRCSTCGVVQSVQQVYVQGGNNGTLGAVIGGRAGESVLDFYAAERRRVFLEVTSPMSANFKRLLSEKDPARRAQDKAEMFAQAEKGGAEVRASSLAELIKGAPMPVEPAVA